MLTVSTAPSLTGCSHSCRSDRGMCLDCGYFTGVPGVVQGPYGRFPTAKALEFFLAKQSFKALVDGTTRAMPQSAGWLNLRRQCRRNAGPHMEALAAIYWQERRAAERIAAE